MSQTTDFTNFATEYPNYFPGQYLLEEDFELQHKYLSDRQRYRNQSLHVSGIIEGLEVEVTQGQDAVLIKTGSAIDSQGNLIVLKEDITYTDFNDITNGELYIKYQEEKQNKQQNDVDESYTRRVEKPVVEFAEGTPDNGVKLVKLIISEGNITLDSNDRQYSGISLPNSNSKTLTLRSQGNANPNLAVLTGSLKIDGDLKVNQSFQANSNASGERAIFMEAPEANGNHRGDGIQKPTGLVYRVKENPDSGDPIFQVRSSGNAVRLFVEHDGWTGSRENSAWFGGAKNNYFNGSVGIGIKKSGNFKLNVQGSQYLKGSLTIEEGNIKLNGKQQIVFTNNDTTNNLKVQLWDGYGLGINSSTLFYTANGNHSWRDSQNNERMLLTTGANGGLTVKGTGTSSFAGNLSVSNGITSRNGIIIDGNREHINKDGAFYRHDGQVYITIDDNLYIRDHSRSKHIHIDVRNQKINYSSDARLKKNIQSIESGKLKLLSLQGVTFQWKENESSQQTDRQLGFIAQEVESIFPELVQVDSDGMRTMNYTGLIAPMIEAIKEQQKQIAIFSIRLEEQQNNNVKLRN